MYILYIFLALKLLRPITNTILFYSRRIFPLYYDILVTIVFLDRVWLGF